jgi:hypothetical protein
MKIVCRDCLQKATASAPEGRAVNSVSADINRLLSPKSYEELEALEVQIRRKLNSNDPIDTDYWEQLLRSLTVWKARAKLKKVYQAVIDGRVQGLRQQQREEAEAVRRKLAPLAPLTRVVSQTSESSKPDVASEEFDGLDPEPLLQLGPENKSLEILNEEDFLNQVVGFSLSPPNNGNVSYVEPGSRPPKGFENGIRSAPPAHHR